MRIVKKSSTITFKRGDNDSYVNDVDSDLTGIVQALSGRLRLGTGTDGTAGENLSGEFQQFTTSATPNAENTVAHTVGSVPVGYLILWLCVRRIKTMQIKTRKRIAMTGIIVVVLSAIAFDNIPEYKWLFLGLAGVAAIAAFYVTHIHNGEKDDED